MPIYSTNWSDGSINSTNWVDSKTGNYLVQGSPIGLLLTLTYAQSEDTGKGLTSTNWSNTNAYSTSWESDIVFVDEIGLQDGSTLVLQSGDQLLIP